MRRLQLYAPVLVLLLFAIIRATGASLNSVALFILAGSVYLHVRVEHTKR